MAARIRISTSEWNRMSPTARNLLQQTAEGTNSNVSFNFRELRLPRGYVEHPPNTDRTEVRNSLTVEFLGTPHGNLLVHLFNDGTIKTRDQMNAENNQRVIDDQRLAVEENKFPLLGQTPVRRQAQAEMLAKIQALRNNGSMSIIAKQVQKRNAEIEYERILEAQARARAVAARAAQVGVGQR